MSSRTQANGDTPPPKPPTTTATGTPDDYSNTPAIIRALNKVLEASDE